MSLRFAPEQLADLRHHPQLLIDTRTIRRLITAQRASVRAEEQGNQSPDLHGAVDA